MTVRFYGTIAVRDASSVKFMDANSSNFVALKSPATVSSDVTFELPAADGTAGQVIKSNASGVLSFVSLTGIAGYVANEHIDHSTVSISAGTGLSGGGDITATRTLSLANTAVSAASYGSASSVATFTVDAQGRLTAAASTAIAITSAAVSDFNEAAQDAVGGILTDTASVDFTYNDGANTISAVVLPAGVNHDALSNFVANKHIDHSSVSIATSATSGLNGGGDLTATRNIVAAPERATAKTAAVAADVLLIADSEAANALKSITIQKILDLVSAGSGSFVADWITADGVTKAITHSLGTKDIMVEVYDKTNDETIYVDSVVRTSTNVVTLTASSAPGASGFRVLIKEV